MNTVKSPHHCGLNEECCSSDDSSSRSSLLRSQLSDGRVALLSKLTSVLGAGALLFAATVQQGHAQIAGASCNELTPWVNGPKFNNLSASVTNNVTGFLEVCLGGVSGIGNLTDAMTTNRATISMTGLGCDAELRVKDNDSADTYPAGTYAGFKVSGTGLLSTNIASTVKIITYNNKSIRETFNAITSTVGLDSSLLDGNGDAVLGFVTSQDFDEVRIEYKSLVGLLFTAQVYHAVIQKYCAGPASTCDVSYLNNPTYPVFIDAARTGIDGTVCALCSVNDAQRVIDSDPANYATIILTFGVGTTGSIAVKDQLSTYAAGTFAGFDVQNTALIGVGALNGASVSTYNNGVFRESIGGSLLTIDLLTSSRQRIGFETTLPFDEIRLTLSGLADVNLGSTRVYGAFVKLTCLDTDDDGVPDDIDLDDDNDGIPDTVEIASALNGGDTDGDGIPDHLDLDSDNDGILDFAEARNLTPAQILALDANKDGRLDGAVGTDGIPDSVQASPNAGTVNYTPLDTDGDGRPDFQDLDSDNDGINDVREANGTDADGDGQTDGASDANGIPANVPAGGLIPVDTDGDSKPDFRDLDSDNDGINDVIENGGMDPDNNGIVGTGQTPIDTDGDGIADVADGTPAVFGDSGDLVALNSDNDTIPNYRDLDSDNDSISDVIEGGNGPADTDGDGTISPAESGDTDGDGIPDSVDDSPIFGDAGNPVLPEQGGLDIDTIPDFLDTDSDGDGITDLVQSGKDPAIFDTDNDGMIDNPVDPDGDGIPNNYGNDTKPDDFGGITAPTPSTDTDDDGIPDSTDLDDDDDGIPDTVEIANAINGGDSDGDGIPDHLDLDSDGDGIFDVIEAGHAGVDADKNGRIDSAVGTNGLADIVETSPGSGMINYVPRDTDNDGRPDYLDLDSDNDSISDILESGNLAVTDANNDGIADGPVNANGIVLGAGANPPVNSDSDNLPDYRDVDRNDDGINDIVDNGYGPLDANNDGKIDVITDGDADGIADILDANDAQFGFFPTMGCAAWSLANPADTDGDVFPAMQEYAFGGSPTMGDHMVASTLRRAGLVLTKNGTGGLDASVVRPQGRYDVGYTLIASPDLAAWSNLAAAPAVTSNGDDTDTLTWTNIQGLAPLTADRGYVRLRVTTTCEPAGSQTLVQGWCREDIVGKTQTYGVNFTSLPAFTGIIDSSSGSSLTVSTSASGLNLGDSLAGGTHFIELTDGADEGQRFDIAAGGVNSLTLDLASPNNSSSLIPAGAIGSHFVVRKHRTLGGIFPNADWNASNAVGSSDQLQIYNGSGFDVYYNNSLTGTWVRQGSGLTSQNSTVIAPGVAMFVIHADSNDRNSVLTIGDVRYNDFVCPLRLGTTGLTFVAQGFPLDATPASLLMTIGNGFIGANSSGSATQILVWKADTAINAVGYDTNFLFGIDGSWRRQVGLVNTTNDTLFKECRGVFVDVQTDKLDWKHVQPWSELPWIQP